MTNPLTTWLRRIDHTSRFLFFIDLCIIPWINQSLWRGFLFTGSVFLAASSVAQLALWCRNRRAR